MDNSRERVRLRTNVAILYGWIDIAWSDVSLRAAVASPSPVLRREARFRELAKPRVAESGARTRDVVSCVHVDVSRVFRRVRRTIVQREHGEDGIEATGFADLRLGDLAGGERRELCVRTTTQKIVIFEHDWGRMERVFELSNVQGSRR